MSCKKLDTVLFDAWNTYAISMMSILEDCGMWNKEFTFQKFLGVTGIASQFCMDTTCSALPITDYDWLLQNPLFMKRIGVTTDMHFANATDTDFKSKQSRVVEEIKQSLDRGSAVTVWGIDTGEFGIICGYDDEDGIFFAKGIGTNNSNYTPPILYTNLGKSFTQAPILYCEIPISHKEVDWKQAYMNSLKIYSDEMKKEVESVERAYGLKAYDKIIDALSNNCCDDFGLRYCVGVYYERKDAMFCYLNEIKALFCDLKFNDIIDIFGETANCWRKLMFDVLNQGTCGWNDLVRPIDKDLYQSIIGVIQEIKSNEMKAIKLINEFLQ